LLEFRFFDYHLFIVTLSILSLSVSGSKKWSVILSSALALCTIFSGIMAARAIYGVKFGAYHAYVAGAVIIPFLTLFISAAGLLLSRKNSPASQYAALCLVSLQFFPAAVFVLQGLLSVNTLFYIADANFVGVSPGLFPWWSRGRFVAMFVQFFAFAPFFALSLAQMTPEIFTRDFDKKNLVKSILVIIGTIIAVTLATLTISLISDIFLVAGRTR
jgi:hypothetical protein